MEITENTTETKNYLQKRFLGREDVLETFTNKNAFS